MSIHIKATKGDIAEKTLVVGDPLRAKAIAEKYFDKAVCYNKVRNMLGYTGHYKGERVSVQSVGMGMPSMSIYAHELIVDYGVKAIIRLGTTGAIQEKISVRDIILAQGACTDSNMPYRAFRQQCFSAIADFDLLQLAVAEAKKLSIPLHVGNVLTSDIFYSTNDDDWRIFADHGVLSIEMEVASLYMAAARYGIHALALLTVSDHLLTRECLPASERQSGFMDMVEVGLATMVDFNKT